MTMPMGAHRIFSKGVQTQRLVRSCRAYLSSVCLWNTNICCRISLCRKESDSVSVSDSENGYVVFCKKTEKQNPGSASAPPCTCALDHASYHTSHHTSYHTSHPLMKILTDVRHKQRN